MIVICEHCETRFKLDESRIPAGGAKVRCSRCKHAFFLPAPGGDEPDLLDELISETAAAPLRAPHPTEDLSGGFPLPEAASAEVSTEAPAQAPTVERAGAPSREADANESEWEFGEDFPGGDENEDSMDLASDRLEPENDAPGPDGEASGLELETEVEVSPAIETAGMEAAPVEDPAAPEAEIAPDLGASSGPAPETDPEEGELNWAFDDEDLGEPDTQPEAPPAAPHAPAPALAPASTRPEALTPSAPSELLEAPEGVGRVLEAAGWLATAVFAGLVTVQLLLPASLEGSAPVSELAAGPFVAESLRGRFVENLFVGPLLVVTGELHNPGDEPSSLGAVLQAVLLDAEGSPIAGSKAALAPAAERELREQAPEVLAARLADRARMLSAEVLAPGARLDVTAVFPGAAGEALGFSLEMGPPTATPPLQPSGADPLAPSTGSRGSEGEAAPAG